MERRELISKLKERLEYMPDEKLQDLLKRTKEPTPDEIKADIERLSKNIRNSNARY